VERNKWVWVEQRSFDLERKTYNQGDLWTLFSTLENACTKEIKRRKCVIERARIVVAFPRVQVAILLSVPAPIVLKASAHLTKNPIRTITSRIFKLLADNLEPT